MFNMLASFAEFERSLIRERQREGIALAKKKGVYRGRKPALTDDQAAMLRKRAAGGEKKAVLARELGISRETLYQYLRHKSARLISALLGSLLVAPDSPNWVAPLIFLQSNYQGKYDGTKTLRLHIIRYGFDFNYIPGADR